jgi:hypothetical protein
MQIIRLAYFIDFATEAYTTQTLVGKLQINTQNLFLFDTPLVQYAYRVGG